MKIAPAPGRRLVLLNKPFGVLSQFTGEPGQRTLADYVKEKAVYAAGRLDADSEGLLLLTDDGAFQHQLADPRHKMPKIYLAQVEGEPTPEAVQRLCAGLDLGDFVTHPCRAEVVQEPEWLWPRDPPIRVRLSIPTSWLRIELREGKNRQVRRMTAKVGFPTLRLIRASIGPWQLGDLQPGQVRILHAPAEASVVPVERSTQGRRRVKDGA
jgi:23S rRNA pseudouridine2457 synthase